MIRQPRAKETATTSKLQGHREKVFPKFRGLGQRAGAGAKRPGNCLRHWGRTRGERIWFLSSSCHPISNSWCPLAKPTPTELTQGSGKRSCKMSPSAEEGQATMDLSQQDTGSCCLESCNWFTLPSPIGAFRRRGIARLTGESRDLNWVVIYILLSEAEQFSCEVKT